MTPTRANSENQAALPCPCGTMMSAAEQRTYGRAEVAADLEQGLGQTRLVAGRHAGDPEDSGGGRRTSRMPISMADSSTAPKLPACDRESKPIRVKPMPRGKRIRHGPTVCVEADQRLQQRARELVGEGDEPIWVNDRSSPSFSNG